MSVALLDGIRPHIVVNFLVEYFGYKMTEAKKQFKSDDQHQNIYYPNANR